MVIFPFIATILALGCGGAVVRDYLARPKPDKVAWALAFAMFAAAAGAEVVGSLAGWSAPLARVYYALGATLVVGYLALGELYLLMRREWADRAAGVLVGLTALAVALVWRAPVEGRLADDGWEALRRGPGLTALTIGINSVGTLILLGGLLYSAWRFKQRGIMRNRMLGCLLIAAGTLAVAGGGILTRLGSHQFLYIAMSIGTALIFAGYLRARQPDVAPVVAGAAGASRVTPEIALAPRVAPASRTLSVTFVRAAGGQIVVPSELSSALGVRDGDLIALVQTDEGLLVTTREMFTTTVLDGISAALGDEPPAGVESPTSNGHVEVMSERPASVGRGTQGEGPL